LLAFPWTSLAESGLFNGLQPIQIKNLFPFQRLREMSQGSRSRQRLSLFLFAAGRLAPYPANGKVITRISGLRNKLHGGYFLRSLRARLRLVVKI
jgi:hypothetical protein